MPKECQHWPVVPDLPHVHTGRLCHGTNSGVPTAKVYPLHIWSVVVAVIVEIVASVVVAVVVVMFDSGSSSYCHCSRLW